MRNPSPPPLDLESLLARTLLLGGDEESELLDLGTPLGRATRAFFANSWSTARDGLLARTQRLRLTHGASEAPRTFRFEADTPYKDKPRDGGPVTLVPGPVVGSIRYRPDVMDPAVTGPGVAVFLRNRTLYHPNFARRCGFLCLGPIPDGPFPLDALLEHLWSILTYQNRATHDHADDDAALYFSQNPDAMTGLETPRALY